MKIGIITCWQPDDNYGTQIQCFALQQYLRLQGHEAFLIRYLRESDQIKTPLHKRLFKIFNIIKLLKYIFRSIEKKRSLKETMYHNRGAPGFREKYLDMSIFYNSYSELKANPPDAELYIVGSDQVWNISYLQKNNINAHFLNFGSEAIKRISYAASFGFSLSDLNQKYGTLIAPLLKRFSAVSVRESTGLEICNHLGISNAVQVCDPTLLLDTTDYLDILEDEKWKRPEKKYIFIYALISQSLLSIKQVQDWAVKNNLDVIYTSAHGKVDNYKKYYATIPEWIYLIANAEYVITNSFHGAVFSLLFHKKVAVYPLCLKSGASTNSRLDTLNMLAGRNIVVNSNNSFEFIFFQETDWVLFENNKDTLKKSGVRFLDEFLLHEESN